MKPWSSFVYFNNVKYLIHMILIVNNSGISVILCSRQKTDVRSQYQQMSSIVLTSKRKSGKREKFSVESVIFETFN